MLFARRHRLFANFHTRGSTHDPLHITVDSELTSSDGTNHEETADMLAECPIIVSRQENLPRTNTSIGAGETELLTDLHQTGHVTLTRGTLGLVDLGKHSVGGLRDESSGETSNQTRAQVNTSLGAVGKAVLVDRAVDGLRDLLEDDELGHGVGDPKHGVRFPHTYYLR